MKPQRRSSRRSTAALLVAGLLAVALPAYVPSALARAAAGQPPAVSPDSGPALTATARAQLAAARRATAALQTPEAAEAAGYRPMFGHVPLQGEHYVRIDLVASDSFDVARPPVLMFAPVKGTPALVGAAYAYLRPAGASPPEGFDGAADVWHDHPGLARVSGRHLVMTHAWFVDAPDGPFARYNPWLPYHAVGLTPPSRTALADSAAGDTARELGLALALATTPPMLFELIEARADTSRRERLTAARQAITALVPRLVAAERAADHAAYTRVASEVARHGDALVQLYRAAAGDRPRVRRLVDRTVDEFMGRGHGIEEELDALLQGSVPGRTEPPREAGHRHHDPDR